MPVEGGVAHCRGLKGDCKAGGVFVFNESGHCLAFWRDSYDGRIFVGLFEGYADGHCGGKDSCFTDAVAAEVCRGVDGEIAR